MLILRVVVGLLMIGPASQKLTGAISCDWFAKTAAVSTFARRRKIVTCCA